MSKTDLKDARAALAEYVANRHGGDTPLWDISDLVTDLLLLADQDEQCLEEAKEEAFDVPALQILHRAERDYFAESPGVPS